MKAIQISLLQEGTPTISLADVPKPVVEHPQEAVVRVLAVGLDGTDREILQQHYGVPPEGEDALITGHESLGVVVEAGADCGLSPGDLVTALVRRPCKEQSCVNCRNGHADFCQTGRYTERGIRGANGFLTEYYKEEGRYLIPIPSDLLEVGMLAEPQSIVEKVWDQVQRVQQRLIWEPRTALVLGSGPLGLLAAATCRLLGLETHVWSMSPADSLAAQLVRDCGAEYRQAPGAPAAAAGGAASPAGRSAADGAGEIAASAVPAKGAGGKEQASAAAAPQSPPAKGAAPSGSGSGAALGSGLSAYVDSLGRPVDLIFECTGYSPLAFEAMGALGPNGVLALLGVTPADRKLEIPSDALNQEIVLENKCVLGSVNASRKDFETGLYRLGEMQRRYPELLAGLITNRLKLEDVPQLDFAQIPIKAVVDVVPKAQWADMVKPSTEPAYSFSV